MLWWVLVLRVVSLVFLVVGSFFGVLLPEVVLGSQFGRGDLLVGILR